MKEEAGNTYGELGVGCMREKRVGCFDSRGGTKKGLLLIRCTGKCGLPPIP